MSGEFLTGPGAQKADKPAIVKCLKKRYADCFKSERPDVKGCVYVDDAMLVLKSIRMGYENNILRPRDIVEALTKKTKNFLDGSTLAKTAVISFDKSVYVRDTKSEEQINRDLRTSQSDTDKPASKRKRKDDGEKTPKKRFKEKFIMPNDGIPHEERRPYLTLDGGFPHDWEEALSSRKSTLRHIIRQLCCWMLDPTSPVALTISYGTRVFIDGHCLTVDDAVKLDIDLPEDLEEPITDELLYTIPLCYDFTSADGVKKYFVYDMCNTNGEADESVFTSHFNLCAIDQAAYNLIIGSCDTDLMLNAICYLKRFENQVKDKNGKGVLPEIWLKRDMASWVFKYDTPYKNSEEWVSINKLSAEITKDLKTKGCENPIWNFVCAMVLAGGDYTFPFYNVNHHCFFDALMDHFSSIGELVRLNDESSGDKFSYGIFVQIEAVTELIKFAYIYGMTNGADKDSFMSAAGVKSISDVKKKYSKYEAAERKFPGPQTLRFRILQLLYKMKLMIQIGCDYFIEPDPKLHEYTYLPDPREKDKPEGERRRVPFKKRKSVIY